MCVFLLNCNTMLILFTIQSRFCSLLFTLVWWYGGCTIVHFDSASSVFLNLLVIAKSRNFISSPNASCPFRSYSAA